MNNFTFQSLSRTAIIRGHACLWRGLEFHCRGVANIIFVYMQLRSRKTEGVAGKVVQRHAENRASIMNRWTHICGWAWVGTGTAVSRSGQHVRSFPWCWDSFSGSHHGTACLGWRARQTSVTVRRKVRQGSCILEGRIESSLFLWRIKTSRWKKG